jgi:molybdate transport system substrate-binding protein
MSRPLRVISSKATAALLPKLLGECCDAGGERFECLSIGGVDALARLRAEGSRAGRSEPSELPFDIAVLERSAMEALVAESLVIPETLNDLVLSHTAMAVRQGAPRPPVATLQELVATLRNAPSIGYSTGPSGRELIRLLEQWGLLSDLAGRLVQAPAGVPVARLIATGEAFIGFQQFSELREYPGIELLGAMPAGAEIDTLFSVGVCHASPHAERARRIVKAMVAIDTLPTRRRCGFDDPPPNRTSGVLQS